jgi:hypothetical protein
MESDSVEKRTVENQEINSWWKPMKNLKLKTIPRNLYKNLQIYANKWYL